MDKVRTIILVVSCLLAIVGSTTAGIWYSWVYPKNYEYALRLADDASLPETKADYLRQYKEQVSTITGKPAYIFMRPDLELSRQMILLEGLIKRFDDIAKISPNEMAYQQGMLQLTGQEIDHQLDRISTIFRRAKLRENPLLFVWIVLQILWWTLAVVFLFWKMMEDW